MSLIKDPYLKQVIQNTLGPDVPLTQSTLQTISVLDASHQQIQSLDGIEHCRHLQKLYLTLLKFYFLIIQPHYKSFPTQTARHRPSDRTPTK